MNNTALKILNLIAKKNEITLGDLSKLLQKKHKNHRDFYILSKLITGGYIDIAGENDLNQQKTMDVAKTLYTMTLGSGEFDYLDRKGCNSGDLNNVEIFCTSKGDLYIEESKQKRNERLFVLAVGIIVGLITAISSAYFQNYFDKNETYTCQQVNVSNACSRVTPAFL